MGDLVTRFKKEKNGRKNQVKNRQAFKEVWQEEMAHRLRGSLSRRSADNPSSPRCKMVRRTTDHPKENRTTTQTPQRLCIRTQTNQQAKLPSIQSASKFVFINKVSTSRHNRLNFIFIDFPRLMFSTPPAQTFSVQAAFAIKCKIQPVLYKCQQISFYVKTSPFLCIF